MENGPQKDHRLQPFNLMHVDICLTPGTSAHAKANKKLIKKPRMAIPTSLAVS
jgi:hypothetical protein